MAAEIHFQVTELVRVVYEIYEIAGMIDDEMRMLFFLWLAFFGRLVQEHVEIYTRAYPLDNTWHWRPFPFYFRAQFGVMEFCWGTCCVVGIAKGSMDNALVHKLRFDRGMCF